jgi:UDP-2,3-diacylglucosamine hydrolase
MSEGANLAIVGDVHLRRDDEALPDFLAFLDDLGERCSRVIFAGDLFEVWLGKRELEQPHHGAVLSCLASLRERGVSLRYVEGNHDFNVGPCYGGDPFDDVDGELLEESFGGLRILVAHGDLANSEDRRYRRWRTFVKSRLTWTLFNLLPLGRRFRAAEALERRLRRTNLEFKREFPEEQILAYASEYLGAGYDVVVLGHFHTERDLLVGAPRPRGRVMVLPEWKGSRRHIEVDRGGAARFVDSSNS